MNSEALYPRMKQKDIGREPGSVIVDIEAACRYRWAVDWRGGYYSATATALV